jgi:hypothetical protein
MVQKPFKNREDIKRQLRECERWGDIVTSLAFLLAVIGIIWRVFKIDYGFDSTSWFLLAVFFGVISLAPHISFIALKSWYGVESERKNK